LFLLILMAAQPGRAEPLLGASDVFGFQVAPLSDSQRREVWKAVVPVVQAFAPSQVRLGSNADNPFAWGALEDQPGKWRFAALDELIRSLRQAGAEPIIVLSQANGRDHAATTLTPADAAAYQEYVRLVVERYDGDLEFGLNEGEAYPDVNYSGEANYYDWHTAPDGERQAWADAHLVEVFQVEDDLVALLGQGGIPGGEYGTLFAATAQVIRAQAPGARVMLAGVRVAASDKPLWLQAVKAAIQAGATPDLADARVVADEGWFGGLAFEKASGEFPTWLSGAGLAGTPFVLGRAVASAQQSAAWPWEAGDGPRGTCHHALCSERSQLETLLKGLVLARWKGDRPLLAAPLIEAAGPQGYDPRWSWCGLVVAEGSLLSPTLRARPAWAGLKLLAARFPAMQAAELHEVLPVPPNARAFRVDGPAPSWLAWYDWAAEVPEGLDYQGATKNLSLPGVAAPAVRLTHLFPASMQGVDPTDPASLPGFPTEVACVTDGALTLSLGQDVLLVEPLDESPLQCLADAEGAEATEASSEAVPEVVEEAGGGGGCSTGTPALPSGLGTSLLFLLALVASRNITNRRA
jgi:hypothetical protein